MPVKLSVAEMVAMARSKASPGKKETPTDAFTILGAYPFVDALLAASEEAAGGDKNGPTILIFRKDGTWRFCLNDREQGRSVWAEGGTWEEALASLEGRLSTGTAEWRADAKRTVRRT